MEIQSVRRSVQIFFFLLISSGVYEFYKFVYYGSNRPDFTDAFLPIAGVFDVILKVKTGVTDPFHPAAMAIILSTIFTTLLIGKSFCGWICPVGTFLDFLTYLRVRNLRFELEFNKLNRIRETGIFRILDAILRTPKYLIAFWFIYVMIKMPAQAMIMIARQSNVDADIKLFKFWIDLFHGKENSYAVIFLLIIGFSFIIPRFWCRYLCPLGAFYGVFNMFSLLRLRREKTVCKNCRDCNVCPVGLLPFKSIEFNNTECIMCLKCQDSCSTGALKLEIFGRSFPKLLYPVVLLVLFFGSIAIFKMLGVWHSVLTLREEAFLLLKNGFNSHWIR